MIGVTPSVPKYKTLWQAKLTCKNVLYLGTEKVGCFSEICEIVATLTCKNVLYLETEEYKSRNLTNLLSLRNIPTEVIKQMKISRPKK